MAVILSLGLGLKVQSQSADPGRGEDANPPSPSKTVSDLGRPMNLDVQGADLRTVLRSISEFAGVNIVADRGIEGPISIRLFQVPWRRALEIVCRAAGLVALDEEGYIHVATLQTWRDEGIEGESAARKKDDLLPLITRIFRIRFATATELKESVAFALSKRGSSQADERSNALLINDIEPRLEDVARLIDSLDTETQQVEIVARLVDADRTAARQLGIDWNLKNLHSSSQQLSGSASVNEALATKSGTVKIGLVRGFGNLDAAIDAMEQANDARLISNPKITTVNNRRANILVGKEIPLVTLDQSGNPITELKKVGISLDVTPHVNTKNQITLDLHPEVSDLSSQATVQGGLVFTNTSADTRIMVGDGETAAIGGLIQTNRTDFQEGIPILRSLPFVGALFRKSDSRSEERELLIFVTPRIVSNVAAK